MSVRLNVHVFAVAASACGGVGVCGRESDELTLLLELEGEAAAAAAAVLSSAITSCTPSQLTNPHGRLDFLTHALYAMHSSCPDDKLARNAPRGAGGARWVRRCGGRKCAMSACARPVEL